MDCGSATWRSTAAVCSVAADGGASGLPTLTATRPGGSAENVSGGRYTVDGDGAATLTFHAVDGAGNAIQMTKEVRVDRTPPAAGVSCEPGAGVSYVCKASGSDALSGIAAVRWSVDGSAPISIGNQASFTVNKGTVVVTATDAAGNAAASGPVTLADRTPAPKPPVKTDTPSSGDETVTARTTSEAVLLRRGRSPSARLLGQIAIAATPTATTVDLRPLALGSGTFRFVIKVTSGKKTKTVRKTVKTRKGYSPRISVTANAASHTKVALTVQRKSGRRWLSYASGTAALK